MISVIVTVYNKKPWLERCLDSIVNQTDKEHQVIVVDDGSSDGSDAICNKYKEHGFEVYHTKNYGVSHARNYGMKKAKGEYITFMDSDDSYEPNAFEIMRNMTKNEEYNIIQFGQYRGRDGYKTPHHMDARGDYELPKCVDYWEFTTNKLYKRKFLERHKIKFREGLQFGEDEMFNVEAILANNGLRQASVILYNHYFDDKKSLCRGGLDLEKLENLEMMLKARLKKLIDDGGENWVNGAEWLLWQLRRHYNSATFKRFGFVQKPKGKYDIVYFVKNAPRNEELRYSLRSVERNWSYNEVWFYGGCPDGIKPDHHIEQKQNAPTKWENVRNMMIECCKNDNITENFWLFNDDFFILKRVPENIKPRYDGTITIKIEQVRAKHHGEDSEWTKNLAKLRKLLLDAGKTEYCYAIHEPMLVNRKKMLETLEKYPKEPMIRALYGNYWGIGGENEPDPKYSEPNDKVDDDIEKLEMISTSDESFRAGFIGRWIRDKFSDKSRFEA